MRTTQCAAIAMLIVQLSACTSADVAIRKPQDPGKDAAQASAPPHLPAPMPNVPRPVSRPPPMMRPQVAVPPSPPVAPSAPVPITGCDPGGCWGAGERYQGGAGNTYLDRNGRMCQGNGTWMQCY